MPTVLHFPAVLPLLATPKPDINPRGEAPAGAPQPRRQVLAQGDIHEPRLELTNGLEKEIVTWQPSMQLA